MTSLGSAPPACVELAGSAPFVGRAAERSLLLGTLRRPPAVVLVEGEAGVGKSRLVAEVLTEAATAGRRLLVGRCHDGPEPFPFEPFVDALRSVECPPAAASLSPVAGVVARLVPELAAWLPAPPEPLADVRAERYRMFRGLVELLAALGPAVLVVEDLHWADDSSRSLLDYLLAQLPQTVSVVVTYRAYELDDASRLVGQVTRLPAAVARARVVLEPLDPAATAQLVSGMLGGQQVSGEFAAYLWDKTSGLPFALEEVLRLLADRGDLVHSDGLWVRRDVAEMHVPSGFAATVEQRVQALPSDAVRLLQAAAVIGMPADDRLLSTVAELPPGPAVEAVAAALDAALLCHVEHGVDFRHVLAREAVYQATREPQRRRLHLRAAEALAQRQPAPWGQIAHHYRQAGQRDAWLDSSEAAADAAAAKGDDAAAMAFLQDIVGDHAVPADRRGRAALNFAEAALQAAAHERGLAILTPALDAPWLHPDRRGELRLLVGCLHNRIGQLAEGMRHIRRSVEELQHDPAWHAEALSLLTRCNADSTVEEELRWLEQAHDAASRQTDRAVVTMVLVDRATILIRDGHRAAEVLAAIPADGSSLSEARRLIVGEVNIGYELITVGRYREAEAHLDRGARLAERVYDRFTEPFHGVRLLLRWACGDIDGLEEDAGALVASPFAPTAHDARLVLGSMLLARGEAAEGERLLCDVVDDGQRAGQFSLACWARGELAAYAVAAGDPAAAIALVDDGLDLMRRKRQWSLAAELLVPAVGALCATGADGVARSLLQEVSDAVAGRELPVVAAALVHAAAVREQAPGQPRAAAALFGEADGAWSDLPRPLLAARARAAAGRCLLAAGDGEGEQALRSSLEVFTQLRVTRDANQVRAVLREHGLSGHRRRGRRGYGEQLSPREREVAGLAAAGRTNGEIAQLLVLSPRTVVHHMTRVLRKLDVDSRAGLRGVDFDGPQ
jgi:DNA-binding CsgD family transcriptional regulator/tetratricopeptide (TPR) repeat protein